MLNCTATCRRRDKKLADNKLNAVGIAGTFGESDAIRNVIDMGNAIKAFECAGTAALSISPTVSAMTSVVPTVPTVQAISDTLGKNCRFAWQRALKLWTNSAELPCGQR